MTLRINGKKDDRQISRRLGAVLLDTLGLAAAIEWHAHRFQKRTGVLCEVTVDRAAALALSENHAATIFGVCNEALSTVGRHAGANRVAIAVTPHEVTVRFSLAPA